MLYMESRKSFEVGSMKKFNSLPSVKKYSANYHLCRVPKIIHSANKFLPSVKKHSANTYLCWVPKIFAECIYFVECFLCDTGQRFYLSSARNNAQSKVQHSTNSKSPVVVLEYPFLKFSKLDWLTMGDWRRRATKTDAHVNPFLSHWTDTPIE